MNDIERKGQKSTSRFGVNGDCFLKNIDVSVCVTQDLLFNTMYLPCTISELILPWRCWLSGQRKLRAT